MRPKRLALLGSTGSIGTQVLQVVAELAGRFEVVGLSAGRNVARLAEQCRTFHPQAVSVVDEEHAEALRREPGLEGVAIHTGEAGLRTIATWPDADLVVVGVTGALGLQPLLAALEAGKDVATANKEPLVAAGELIMRRVRAHGGQFLPIDSEHSAIFQVLRGEDRANVRRLLLTASGGPFRGWTKEQLARVTPAQALAHPTWKMGPKITIDSATLMNKGLEVMEARWLFDVPVDRIEVVIHPQSIIHSLVEFVDGSVLAQMDYPDMRTPIQFALTFPERCPSRRRSLELTTAGPLTFERPDVENFPCLGLAYEAARAGGTWPAVLNAANEVAVQRFLEGEIGFLDIPQAVGAALDRHDGQSEPTLEHILAADAWARAEVRSW